MRHTNCTGKVKIDFTECIHAVGDGVFTSKGISAISLELKHKSGNVLFFCEKCDKNIPASEVELHCSKCGKWYPLDKMYRMVKYAVLLCENCSKDSKHETSPVSNYLKSSY